MESTLRLCLAGSHVQPWQAGPDAHDGYWQGQVLYSAEPTFAGKEIEREEPPLVLDRW
jgi:hypothetical protein